MALTARCTHLSPSMLLLRKEAPRRTVLREVRRNSLRIIEEGTLELLEQSENANPEAGMSDL